jgi:hypothetical protein
LICIGNSPVGCSTTKPGEALNLLFKNTEWTRKSFIRKAKAGFDETALIDALDDK